MYGYISGCHNDECMCVRKGEYALAFIEPMLSILSSMQCTAEIYTNEELSCQWVNSSHMGSLAH